jgi:hypothetical protein
MRTPQLDPHPFSRGGSVALVATAVMHVYLAALLSWQPPAIHATDLTAVMLAFRLDHLAHGIAWMQLLMCAASSLAVAGAFFRVGWVRIVIFIPQHLILGAMAWGGLYAALLGHYLDATPMVWSHINADQIGYICLFFVHSSAILRRCWDPNG